jgi:hypothetical protein
MRDWYLYLELGSRLFILGNRERALAAWLVDSR